VGVGSSDDESPHEFETNKTDKQTNQILVFFMITLPVRLEPKSALSNASPAIFQWHKSLHTGELSITPQDNTIIKNTSLKISLVRSRFSSHSAVYDTVSTYDSIRAMSTMDTKTKEALLESLYDLKHDLGKYIKMPVSMLPKDAKWDEVTVQAVKAILETRKGQSGVISAKMLFDQFAAEWETRLAGNEAYQQIAFSVQVAVALVGRIERHDAGLSREGVEQTLGAVTVAISKLQDEVENG
jgi:hypothetical protein